MNRLIGLVALLGILIVVPVPAAFAQDVDYCQTGQAPDFTGGFANLNRALATWMGDPTTCEFPDPNGTGDMHQQTNRGLAFWRKSTNVPTFTNGNEHWALTSQGLLYWTGTSIDPPTNAVAGSRNPCVQTATCPAVQLRAPLPVAVPTSPPVASAAPSASPTPPATYSTANGQKTEAQLRDELGAAGYGGPWDTSSLLTAYQSASAAPIPQPSGVVISQQTTDQPFGYVSVDGHLNPQKHYVFRVTSVPSGLPLRLDAEGTRLGEAITTPYEEQIKFSDSDRKAYDQFNLASYHYVIASKGSRGGNESVTAQLLEIGGAPSDAKAALPPASSSPVAPLPSTPARAPESSSRAPVPSSTAPAPPASERTIAPAAPAPPPTTSKVTPPAPVDTSPSSPISSSSSDGCGSRGGPGYRLHSGKCASWDDAAHGRT